MAWPLSWNQVCWAMFNFIPLIATEVPEVISFVILFIWASEYVNVILFLAISVANSS